MPQTFPVFGVISSTIVLFGTVVNEWDSTACEGENCSRAETLLVVEVMHKSSVIVIVYKNTESINVFKLLALFVVSVTNLVHTSVTSKDIFDSVVHRVVKESSEVILVRANICGISVEAFSHLEDSRTIAIFSPEVLWNLRDSVNSNSVKIEFLDDVLYPVFEIISHVII